MGSFNVMNFDYRILKNKIVTESELMKQLDLQPKHIRAMVNSGLPFITIPYKKGRFYLIRDLIEWFKNHRQTDANNPDYIPPKHSGLEDKTEMEENDSEQD